MNESVGEGRCYERDKEHYLVMVDRSREDCSVMSCLLEAAASWDSNSRICCFSSSLTLGRATVTRRSKDEKFSHLSLGGSHFL